MHTLGDAHLYLNHLGQADTQLRRKPHPLPRMELNASVGSIFDFAYEDFALIGLPAPPGHQGAYCGVIPALFDGAAHALVRPASVRSPGRPERM